MWPALWGVGTDQGPTQEAWPLYLPSLPWPGRHSLRPLPPSPARSGHAGQKPQRKCLFVPVPPKSKQCVVCDPNFLPFFSEHNKAQDNSLPQPPPPRQTEMICLHWQVPSALGSLRGRGCRPGWGGGNRGDTGWGWEYWGLLMELQWGFHRVLDGEEGETALPAPLQGSPRSPSPPCRHVVPGPGSPPALQPILPTPPS